MPWKAFQGDRQFNGRHCTDSRDASSAVEARPFDRPALQVLTILLVALPVVKSHAGCRQVDDDDILYISSSGVCDYIAFSFCG